MKTIDAVPCQQYLINLSMMIILITQMQTMETLTVRHGVLSQRCVLRWQYLSNNSQLSDTITIGNRGKHCQSQETKNIRQCLQQTQVITINNNRCTIAMTSTMVSCKIESTKMREVTMSKLIREMQCYQTHSFVGIVSMLSRLRFMERC